MSEQLLDLLRVGLLALVYLFFIRVLWVVWAELRNPVPAVARSKRTAAVSAAPAATSRIRKRRAGPRLVMRAPVAQAGVSYELAEEMTIGRAPGCAIIIDDSFVSQVHARVFEADGVHHVEDLNSTNGTRYNDLPLTSRQVLRRGDRLTFGDTVLEFTS